MRQLHLLEGEERMLRHERRYDLTIGITSGGALHGGGEEPYPSQPRRLSAGDSVQDEARQRGVLQAYHGISQP